MEPPGKKVKTDPNDGNPPEARTSHSVATSSSADRIVSSEHLDDFTSTNPAHLRVKREEEEDDDDGSIRQEGATFPREDSGEVTSPNSARLPVKRETDDDDSLQEEEAACPREDLEEDTTSAAKRMKTETDDDDDSLQEEEAGSTREQGTENEHGKTEEDDDSLQGAEEATSVNTWKDRLPKPGTARFPKSFEQVLELMDSLIDREPGDSTFWEDLYNHTRHGNRKGIKTRVILRNLKKKGDFPWQKAKGNWCPQTTNDLTDFIIVLLDIAERWS